MPIGPHDVRFQNPKGEPLAGKLHLPAGWPRAYALFAHCFTCSKDLQAVVRIARCLAAEGIATLRFDFTGLGESAGSFAETTVTGHVEDLVAAADYLRREHGAAPRILVGHSLGGAATLLAAGQIPESVAVATIAAPFDPAHVRRLLRDDAARLEAEGEADVEIGGRPFKLQKSFLDDLEAHEPAAAIRNLKNALLIFHSPQDDVVGIDNARKIYEAARHPKSFVSLDGAGHLLPRRGDADYVGRVLAAWASRYLDAGKGNGDDDHAIPRGQVEVTGGAEGTVVSIQAGPHRFGADEPDSVPGGTDTATDPYGLLLGSLGACTVMTLRLYADRKGWPLEGSRVRLRHERIHAEDADALDDRGRKPLIDQIHVDLVIDGPKLDAEQRARLVEIAHRCPVHKTLVTETRIHVREVDG